MGKRLTSVDTFFIDHHKEKMTAEEIAKQIGCSIRTVYNYINKGKGNQRTEEGRQLAKGEPVTPPEDKVELPKPTVAAEKIPVPLEQFIGKRQHGNSSAIVLTKEASEWGDEAMKSGPTKLPPHVHVINPDK